MACFVVACDPKVIGQNYNCSTKTLEALKNCHDQGFVGPAFEVP